MALRSVIAFFWAIALFAGASASAQSLPRQQQNGGVRWEDDSLRFGDSFRLEPKVRLQADFLLHDEFGVPEDSFSWGSRRIGVDGELFNRVQFQIERALQEDDDDDTAWRDVYVDVRINRAFQVRGGRFKLPFSMERTTSRDDLDFLQRATAVRAIAPSRDTGVMVHGRFADRKLEYEAGVFQHADGFENIEGNLLGDFGATLAGRLIFSPIRGNDDGFTRDLQFGAAFVQNDVPEGLNSTVGRTFDGERFFDRLNINGGRTRFGAEGLWNAGRLTLKGEWLKLSDERLGQAVTDEDLSNLVQQGGYITGVVRVLGDPGDRAGAVDVAARLDRLTLKSANQDDEPFTNPRADTVAPLAKDTFTVGANWLPHRWFKVQFNLIQERLVDELGVRDLPTESVWTTVMRLQFSL
jgi:phosphate-selective porin